MKRTLVDTSSILRQQDGAALVAVTVALVAIFAFGIIAIDGSILVTTKTQLQNAADAAALAGASKLASTNGNQTAARTEAKKFSALNVAVREGLDPVVIEDGDVTFPTGPNGELRIRVNTHRTAATNDALRTYFLRVVDLAHPNTANVAAVAEAEVYQVCAVQCLKPWAIPDKWDDVNENGEFDVGIDFYDPILTGYQAPADVGLPITLKVGNPNQAIVPSHFFPVDYPPIGHPDGPIPGGDQYREWISGCAPYTIGPGDQLQREPGNMQGPTKQGIQALYDQDPGAYWDDATKSVQGSSFGLSPRVGLVPFYSPTEAEKSGRNVLTVVKIAAFFIESVSNKGDVTGRFIAVSLPGQPCDDQTQPSFVKGLHLVE